MADRYEEMARELWESLVEVAAVSSDGEADNVTDIAAAIRQAVEAERERCAKIIASMAEAYPSDVFPASSQSIDARSGTLARHLAKTWAEEIRSKPNTSPEQAEVLTRMQKYPKVDATAFASAAEPFTKTEPARPIRTGKVVSVTKPRKNRGTRG